MRKRRPALLAYAWDTILSPQPVSMIMRGPRHGTADAELARWFESSSEVQALSTRTNRHLLAVAPRDDTKTAMGTTDVGAVSLHDASAVARSGSQCIGSYTTTCSPSMIPHAVESSPHKCGCKHSASDCALIMAAVVASTSRGSRAGDVTAGCLDLARSSARVRQYSQLVPCSRLSHSPLHGQGRGPSVRRSRSM